MLFIFYTFVSAHKNENTMQEEKLGEKVLKMAEMHFVCIKN